MHKTLFGIAIAVFIAGAAGPAFSGELYDYRLPSQVLEEKGARRAYQEPSEERRSGEQEVYKKFKADIVKLDTKELQELKDRFSALYKEAGKKNEKDKYLHYSNLLYYIEQEQKRRQHE